MFTFQTACKKNDFSGPELTETNESVRNFFSKTSGVSPQVQRVMDELQRQNNTNRSNLINSIISDHGFARWDKSFVQIKKSSNTPVLGKMAGEAKDTIVIVPLVKHGDEMVNTYLEAHLTKDVKINLRTAGDYRRMKFSNTERPTNYAEKTAIRFIRFTKDVLGVSEFNIMDKRLFRGLSKKEKDDVGKVKIVVENQGNQLVRTECYDIYTWGRCRINSRVSSNAVAIPMCWNKTTECDTWDDSPDYGEFPPSGGGGTPPGNDDPCNGGGLIMNGVLPPSDCDGNEGPGWEPVDPEIYTTNYQMTQHEKDVFDQIDAEDSQSDESHSNLDCSGTKRTGNIYFQGTKEHWLIQLDYVSKNPVFGDAEFAIPHSSSAGNRGYADLVNTLNGNIFEIKPNNAQGIQQGATEVNNYVTKANAFCNSTLPQGTTWNVGSVYGTTFIPTLIPNKYLQAELVAPGVIGYRNVSSTIPVPAPILIPSSILNKFKHLIDRLKLNFQDADRIIAEYLKQNPELLTYIKNAAIGAGIAIIVGTIIEDVITVGAGIADDWACFVLAYRIIRFAIVL